MYSLLDTALDCFFVIYEGVATIYPVFLKHHDIHAHTKGVINL